MHNLQACHYDINVKNVLLQQPDSTLKQELLSEKKNPFFRHSKVQLYLAFIGNKIVGRIAAIRNNEYNKFADTNVGYFGMFDVIED